MNSNLEASLKTREAREWKTELPPGGVGRGVKPRDCMEERNLCFRVFWDGFERWFSLPFVLFFVPLQA